MTKDPLAALERIARLRADMEMRRFAAFRSHVEAARARAQQLEAELQALYHAERPFSVAEARLANTLAGAQSRSLVEVERELERMRPGYELARQAAVREFGRAEAMAALRAEAQTETRQKAQRVSDRNLAERSAPPVRPRTS